MNYHLNNTYVNLVSLNVVNLHKSKIFYEEILGFSVIEESKNQVVFSTDAINPVLIINSNEDIKPRQRNTTGLYHFAILLPTNQDLINLIIRLSQHNIPIGSADHLVSEAIYFDDPDGNGIEVYTDRDSNGWIWQDELVDMQTLPLNINNLLLSYDENHPWTKMPTNAKMGHIHLHVNDIEASKKFYVDGLNFDVVSKYGDQALFISSGKYHHHIGLNTWNGTSAPHQKVDYAGLNHFNIKYPNIDELINIVNNLKQLGYTVNKVNDTYETIDPSENKITLSTK